MLYRLLLALAIILGTNAHLTKSYGRTEAVTQAPVVEPVRPTFVQPTQSSYGRTEPVRPTFVQPTQSSYGRTEVVTQAPVVEPVRPTFVQPTQSSYGSYSSYSSEPVRPTSEQPLSNPCTEEVMRLPEIQLFANPQDSQSYLICTDVDVFLSMPCSPGTVFNQELRHCAPVGWEAPLCPVGTCLNNADCVINEMNLPSCICRTGFTGDRCETNIDDCALEGNNECAAYNGRCVDQVNTYYCEYEGGMIGANWENKIQSPCTIEDLSLGKQFFDLNAQNGAVFLQCTDENKFVVSRCAEMLFWHQELKTCSIERPLAKTGVCRNYPCMNDGFCNDLGGSNFECVCKEGYTGALCEEEIDFCLNQPCGNGRCASHTGGYNCICQENVVDKFCTEGLRNPCQMGSTYLPNSMDSTKYFSCSLGFGFVKTCAPGLVWSQELLTCVNSGKSVLPTIVTEVPVVEPVRPTFVQQTQSSYGRTEVVTQAPVVEPVRPAVVQPTQSSYGRTEVVTEAPVVEPVRPAVVQPTQSSYGSSEQKTQSTFRPQMPTQSTFRPQMPTQSTFRPQMPTQSTFRPQMPTQSTFRPQMPTQSTFRPQMPTLSRPVFNQNSMPTASFGQTQMNY